MASSIEFNFYFRCGRALENKLKQTNSEGISEAELSIRVQYGIASLSSPAKLMAYADMT